MVFTSALDSDRNFGWLKDTSERRFPVVIQFSFVLARRPITSFLFTLLCAESHELSLASASISQVMPMWEAQNEGP